MDIRIRKDDGRVYNFSSLGFNVSDVQVNPPEIRTDYEESDDTHGVFDGSISFGQSIIEMPFDAELEHRTDFEKKKSLLNSILMDTRPFYLEVLRSEEKGGYAFVDTTEAPKGLYAPLSNITGKRYRVRTQSFVEFKELVRHGEGMAFFETIENPFAESINVINRRYTNNEFTFHNQGTQPIDMRAQTETEITFTGESNGLTIRNLTTGDVWKYNGSTTSNDEIMLKGVRSLKNGQSIFGQTNKKLISFAPGNNKIEVSGTSGDFELNISTRFYFL